LIEIDEDAHQSYSVPNELARLRVVTRILGFRILVRVNPDRPGHNIAKKITRAAVAALVKEKKGRLSLADKLAMPQVSKANLERTVDLVETVRCDEKYIDHVVYVDYPLKSPHLADVIGRAGVTIIGRDGDYADLIAVPLSFFFEL
jgi:hypothetical protein